MNLHQTLFDALNGNEEAFAEAVLASVRAALSDLGNDVRSLQWASVRVSLQDTRLVAEAA